MEICIYSGLPYCCEFCPEKDEAPCGYQYLKKSTGKLNQLEAADEKDDTEVC